MFDDALQRYTAALQNGGFNPLVAYNAALCHHTKKENSQALNFIGTVHTRFCKNLFMIVLLCFIS